MFGKKITFINHRLAKAAKLGEKNIVSFRDHMGHEQIVSREEWLEFFLPYNIKMAWSAPDRLAALIIQALKEELYEEMLEPTEQLHRIDPDKERSSSMLVMVYLKLHRVKDAEQVLFRKMHRRENAPAASRIAARL